MKKILFCLALAGFGLMSCQSDEEKIKEQAKDAVIEGFEGWKDAKDNIKAAAEGVKEGVEEIKDDMED